MTKLPNNQVRKQITKLEDSMSYCCDELIEGYERFGLKIVTWPESLECGDCGDWAFTEMNLQDCLNLRKRNEEKLFELMRANKTPKLRRIKSWKKGGLVAYYLQIGKRYLHFGICDSAEGRQERVTSRWGYNAVLINHPLVAVRASFGDCADFYERVNSQSF